MDVSELLDDLNDAQREAVAAPLGNMLVLAGAGSGKTRVLVHRIAWLVQVEQLSPHAIMAVTFTNKAAAEMRARIEDMLQLPTRGLWVGTFHALAHRLLKQHWREAQLPQNFQILDADDQLRVVKRVMKAMQLDEGQWPPKQAQHFINAQKDEGRRAEHIDSAGDLYHRTMLQVYSQYQAACEQGGLVDFAEILLRSHELWLKQPDLLAHYQQRFRCILVDEFQDTNTVQYAWLRVLAGKQMHLMAVGDDDQSIYGWRGAKIENIQRVSQDFAQTAVIRLEQNYRSTSTILHAANAVIANNHDRLGKDLWTDGEAGELIELYAAFNEHDEARFAVDKIESMLASENMRKDDIAMLYRSNAQSRVLEEALIRAAVPYRIYGGQRFYERLEIKHALSYCRLLINRYDDTAFERVLNVPTRGIGNKSVEVLREVARDQGCHLFQAVAYCQQQGQLNARALNAINGFLTLLDEMQAATEELGLEQLLEIVIERSGLIPHFQKEKGEKAQARLDNLAELVAAGREFVADDEEALSPLQQFLDNAALDAGDGQADVFEDSVQLMTLHSAKGLEFSHVFLLGLEEQLFPHKMSLEEPGRLEEERRLCYVGITRAMRRLYLSYAESRRLYGTENYQRPSRFLKEIPSEYVREVRLKSSVSRPVTANSYSKPVAEDVPVQLGGRVMHPKFG
ncbi:MAG: DNA helicase II, partial [Pseudomonadales bacterium]|nr:DNA helicase II [Pseudomonadales bacterium]